jgi:hypothetical protein
LKFHFLTIYVFLKALAGNVGIKQARWTGIRAWLSAWRWALGRMNRGEEKTSYKRAGDVVHWAIL